MTQTIYRPVLLSFACIEGEHQVCPGHLGGAERVFRCECQCHALMADFGFRPPRPVGFAFPGISLREPIFIWQEFEEIFHGSTDQ